MVIFIDIIDNGSISDLELVHWYGTSVSWDFNDIDLFLQK